MKAICNGTDLTDLVGYGYIAEQVPQYGDDSMTALDGTDYSAKLRDRWHLTVPFIALTREQLASVLTLFPTANPYVTWIFDDPMLGVDHTLEMKYSARKSTLMVKYVNGVEYWNGLSVELWER